MAVHLQSGKPTLQKEVTAELGCVTPYIIVPGKWSKKAIAYWADECVAGLINNSGHNCTKLELLITAADWPLRETFIQAVRCECQAAKRAGDVQNFSQNDQGLLPKPKFGVVLGFITQVWQVSKYPAHVAFGCERYATLPACLHECSSSRWRTASVKGTAVPCR